ncbi:hypothetical protein [Thalassotalea crassostreae]|uniref:hypothetical protein n=1 Tax=Thalassotalea crassostreae TaxID=1763536 RepID=UPI0008392ABD|nr:hypothetical protein [Thalassotalea crassostreae]
MQLTIKPDYNRESVNKTNIVANKNGINVKHYVVPVFCAILAHLLIALFLYYQSSFSTSKILESELTTDKPVVTIKSYIYTPAKTITAEEETTVPRPLKQENMAIKPEAIKQKTLTEPIIEEENITVINAPLPSSLNESSVAEETNSEIINPVKTSSTSITSANQNVETTSFDPMKIRRSLGNKLTEKMMTDVQKQRLNQGFSAMQTLPAAVSHSVFKKSELQIKAEATTQVGNETFVKLDGTCMQTTDLSFIDDNLGTATSFSDCGETDDEKYFREFMAQKLEKHKKPPKK